MRAFVFAFTVFGIDSGNSVDREGQENRLDYDCDLHVTCLGGTKMGWNLLVRRGVTNGAGDCAWWPCH